jgi:hypothetical protein
MKYTTRNQENRDETVVGKEGEGKRQREKERETGNDTE